MFYNVSFRMLQALERALEEQEMKEARYQKDFESERTLSSQRELQMLDDFEWKLRETEKNAKKKVEAAEAEATKRIQDMEARLARAEADLERVSIYRYLSIIDGYMTSIDLYRYVMYPWST